MCLGIPARIVAVDPKTKMATVDVAGNRREVNTICIADEIPAERLVNSWVLVHVGFAMSVIDEQDAADLLEVLHEIGEVEAAIPPGGG